LLFGGSAGLQPCEKAQEHKGLQPGPLSQTLSQAKTNYVFASRYPKALAFGLYTSNKIGALAPGVCLLFLGYVFIAKMSLRLDERKGAQGQAILDAISRCQAPNTRIQCAISNIALAY
jgi:hypothetical protein